MAKTQDMHPQVMALPRVKLLCGVDWLRGPGYWQIGALWDANPPGFPFLPCPICHGTEGCDHTTCGGSMLLILQITAAIVLAVLFLMFPRKMLAIVCTCAAVVIALFLLLILWAFDRAAVPGAIILALLMWWCLAHPSQPKKGLFR